MLCALNLSFTATAAAVEQVFVTLPISGAASDMACLFRGQKGPLSLEDAIERILCNEPTTRLAWANAKIQAAQVGMKKSAYLPRLDGSVKSAYGSSKSVYVEHENLTTEGDFRRLSSSLNLSWVVYDFGRRKAALDNAQQLLLAANSTHDVILQSSFVMAAQIYYNALVAKRNFTSSAQVAKMASENLKAADAKYKAGAAALSDQLQAKTAFSQAHLKKIRYAGELRNAIGIMALKMGLPADTELTLSGDLRPVANTSFIRATDALINQAMLENPALLAVRARLQAAKFAVVESRAEGKANISLIGGFSNLHAAQSSSLSGGVRNYEKSIGVQLSIPIFEGFERRYKIRNALAQVEVSEAELFQAEQQVAMDVWSSYQSINLETLSLQRTTELVEQSREALEVVQGRYRSGVGSMIELLNALSAYASAEEQHIQVLNNWQIARLKLAAGLGRLGFWTLK
ncbi:TolC family protein [Pseudomonas sp. HY7a-MNA-CIBAN-0227]|uniref:TolC family protein n=1 Tax=Pseudomonas sp. HY7a-MNA-CIBAN-0227 TaxID=3140474 RepID=UPI003323BAC7